MKCINCNTENKFKERNQNLGQCKHCNHEFVFEPTEMPSKIRITDTFFAKAIAEISEQDTLFFTPRQLYYLLEERLRSRSVRGDAIVPLIWGLLFTILVTLLISNLISSLNSSFLNSSVDLVAPILFCLYAIFAISVVAQTAISTKVDRQIRQDNVKALNIIAIVILVFGIPLSIAGKTLIGIVGSICLSIIAAWLSYDYNRQQSTIFDDFLIDRQDFHDWLNKWAFINDPPIKMLEPPKIYTTQVTSKPKMIAYDFDRVVVCDSPKIAQLLLSNNFHFKNNCAVLAIDRYPQHIFGPIKKMLDQTPDLKVYAFHDCSPQGLKMIRHLRSEKIWFPDLTIPIISIGILPHQVRDNIDLVSQSVKSADAAQHLPSHLRSNLNPTELAWLDAGFYLELESFPPQKLIQILQRAINESYQLAEIEDGDLVVMNGPGFYTLESFG
jgi:hypothetical protein